MDVSKFNVSATEFDDLIAAANRPIPQATTSSKPSAPVITTSKPVAVHQDFDVDSYIASQQSASSSKPSLFDD